MKILDEFSKRMEKEQREKEMLQQQVNQMQEKIKNMELEMAEDRKKRLDDGLKDVF